MAEQHDAVLVPSSEEQIISSATTDSTSTNLDWPKSQKTEDATHETRHAQHSRQGGQAHLRDSVPFCVWPPRFFVILGGFKLTELICFAHRTIIRFSHRTIIRFSHRTHICLTHKPMTHSAQIKNHKNVIDSSETSLIFLILTLWFAPSDVITYTHCAG